MGKESMIMYIFNDDETGVLGVEKIIDLKGYHKRFRDSLSRFQKKLFFI